MAQQLDALPEHKLRSITCLMICGDLPTSHQQQHGVHANAVQLPWHGTTAMLQRVHSMRNGEHCYALLHHLACTLIADVCSSQRKC
jgi:hypothetical protein